MLRIFRAICWAAGLLMALFWLFTARPLHAQEPSLTITDVDARHYPDIQLTVQVTELASLLQQMVVIENGIPNTPTITKVTPLYEIALLTDFWHDPRLFPALNHKLAVAINTSNQANWSIWDKISLFAPTVDGQLQQLVPRDNHDHGAIYNAIYTFEAPPNVLTTPLVNLTAATLTTFAPSSQATKVLLVFSDGYDTTSATHIVDVEQAAQARHVQIYTINFTPRNDPLQIQRLEQLAGAGGGLKGDYIGQPAVDQQSLANLWNSLLVSSRTVTLHYQTTCVGACPVSVAIPTDLNGTYASWPFTIEGPHLQAHVIAPLSGAAYTVTLGLSNTVMTSPTIDVRLALSLSRPLAAPISRVDYLLNGQRVTTRSEPPFDHAEFVVKAPPAGLYTLTANVATQIPAVTATTSTTFTIFAYSPPVIHEETFWQKVYRIEDEFLPDFRAHFVLWLLPLLVAVLALGVAISALWRSRAGRTGPVRSNSQPSRPSTQSSRSGPVHAELLLRQGADYGLPYIIPLYETSTAFGRRSLIGLDTTTNFISIGSPSVAEQHCIIEYKDQAYFISKQDITGETRVNGRNVPEAGNGVRLTPGAVIELGTIKFVYMPTAQREQVKEGTGNHPAVLVGRRRNT
ncbi:MAG: FHA domain-containing protein [Chloroflexi bacterium]|nr:FHA domain-containing protein [Chloroflexota bacterium]